MSEIIDKVIKYIPTYSIVNSLTSLRNAKKEMDNKKDYGYDNYAHRLGMCESAKNGYIGALTGMSAGILKEGLDIARKTTGIGSKRIGFKKALEDSKKDMKNNIEGIKFGLTNDGKECRIWLDDLDYRSNTWRNE